MKVLTCPINGARPLQEFSYGGAFREMPDPQGADDALWGDYVFNRSGEPGLQREWWHHIASNTWFVAERDTLTDEFVRTYLWGAGA